MARRTRRFWSEDEKRRIVAQTYAPRVSVSQVGRRYDINANLIFKWRRDPRYRPTEDGEGTLSFLPVEVVAEPALAPYAASDGRSFQGLEARLKQVPSERAAGAHGGEGLVEVGARVRPVRP